MNFKMRTVTCQRCFLCAAFIGVEERLPLRVRDRGSRSVCHFNCVVKTWGFFSDPHALPL